MKFAQRISSIRRIASNAWSRCSPASASMWPASEASSALAGWIVSPRAASSDVTGSWASHSTTSPGTRRRSSSAIRTSRHACPSPIGDETTSTRRGCEAGRAHRAGIRGPHATSRRRRFTPTGSRTSARCPEPSRTTSRPPVSSATRAPRSGGTISSAVPWTTTTGQRTARHSASAASRSATPCSPRVMARISGVVSSPHATPSSSAFVECGSGSAWREEELEEAPEVLLPVLGGVLGPAAIAPRRLVGEVGHRRAERDHRSHALGMLRRELERVAGAAREPGGDDRIDAEVVEDRDGVGDRLGVGVRARVGGRVGQAAAARVERHDPRVARQMGDLELPQAGVHDRPGRQQQDDRLAGAVRLPPDAHAVALEVSLGVRRARRRPGVRPPHPPTLTAYGRASYTWLNGVSATRRKRVNPPASTTSRMRASPAWAPRASPTSCDSDAGVHRSVENP